MRLPLVLLYREHPRLYRDRIRRVPRWDYYITVAALLIGAAALALGADSVVIAAAAVWTSMTAWFCAKRLRHSSRKLRHIAEMMVTSVLIPPLAVFWRIVGAIRYRAWLA